MIFDIKILGYIKIFENLTKARVKDCFTDDKELIFIVNEGEIGKAIGKQGSTIKMVSEKFKKKIKVIEYNSKPEKFVLNLIYPLKPEVTIKDNKIIIKTSSNQEKGKIFGRGRENFKKLSNLINKYFKLILSLE